ncbi:ATP-binding protein [Edaphobacter bradus]|uniref:ATP-binding protein n=1 Tax=Edaphobacter bradus TaxID=2259016 RepID=UPI0021DFAF9A|nr:ATP-binding protein [Edaphobacter bradus]
MALSFTSGSRTTALARVLLLVAAIAFVDWRISANIPLGMLYLLPVALGAVVLTRFQVVLLGALCTVLAETFDSFAWTGLTSIPRDALYFAAFSGSGLFVQEVFANRKRTALHLEALEREVSARRDAEEQLLVLVASSPIAILTIDAAGLILLANDAAERMFAMQSGTLEGKSLGAYLPILTKVPAFRGGQPSFRTVMQCRGQRNDGESFLAEVWFSTYLTSAGARLAAMVVDASQDLRDREEANLHQLLSGSRIIAGAVSHEVRNVCGAIAVVHQNLARNDSLKENKDFEALGTLVTALERVAALDLRQAAERPVRLNLQSFMEELRIIVGSPLREREIEVSWEIQADLPTVWADRQSLMQVFLNLTRNSEAALEDQALRKISMKSWAQDSTVFIAVADNGPGVKVPELLFRPFQTQSDRVGLGLYLSRALLRSFGGDLRYESTADGAMFVVELAASNEGTDES